MERNKLHYSDISPKLRFSPIDTFIAQIFMQWMRRNGRFASGFAFLLYLYIVLAFGETLHISANYFVILPVFIISMSFGFWGGLAAGICALPANLLFFHILGHPEFSPESKLIAELSGIVVGGGTGFLSDFFFKFLQELERRTAVEKDLRRTLKEKDLLLKELHHRVKNNLSVIMSLARLHNNRTQDEECKEMNKKFIQRLHSIALVHDLLFHTNPDDSISFYGYISELTESLVHSFGLDNIKFNIDLPEDLSVDLVQAVPVGMILNEVLVNAMKHAFNGIKRPLISLTLVLQSDECIISVEDNGVGINESDLGGGLGSRLIPMLVKQINGTYNYAAGKMSGSGGTVFTLSFPIRK